MGADVGAAVGADVGADVGAEVGAGVGTTTTGMLLLGSLVFPFESVIMTFDGEYTLTL